MVTFICCVHLVNNISVCETAKWLFEDNCRRNP